jgi:methylmalonic aciduria homocystinuria type C protein
MSLEWREIARGVAERCAGAGLDLVQPFRVADYNREVEEIYRLPDFARPAALGLVIGNSGALWPRFAAALRKDPSRLAQSDPLDSYAAEQMQRALEPIGARFELRAAPEPPPRRVALQRAAHVAGLAFLAPSFLCVHPRFGPWIGLRGAVAIDVDGPERSTPLGNPCDACALRCAPALARALDGEADGAEPWRRWLAVRDACPVGREHRFGEDQLRYHYVKDRAVLEALLVAPSPGFGA